MLSASELDFQKSASGGVIRDTRPDCRNFIIGPSDTRSWPKRKA